MSDAGAGRGAPRALRRAATALLSAAAGVALGNLLVARFLPLGVPLFRLDPELHFSLRPNVRRMLVMDARAGGAWVPLRVNREGYRGRELAPHSPARLVVLGDSLVLAENVRLEQTFVERLGWHLAQSGQRDVEVVNAGVTGYGPDQSLLKLERELERLRPETVLLVLCATNDFGDLVRNKLFELDSSGALVRFPCRLDPLVLEEFSRAERAGRRWALERLVDQLRDGRLAPTREVRGHDYITEYLQAARAHHIEYFVQRDPRVYSLFHDTYDADVAIFPDSETAQAKLRLMRGVLGRLAELCERRGVQLRALVVPSAVDLCPNFEIRVDPARWPSYSPTRLDETLAQIGERAGIPTLDLFEAFAAAGPDGLFVGAGDIHWNAAGQELAAARCSAFLLERER